DMSEVKMILECSCLDQTPSKTPLVAGKASGKQKEIRRISGSFNPLGRTNSLALSNWPSITCRMRHH
ncbi:MAG: hypothetical protein PHR94_16090, partial [Methylomonas lenta]|nr:hypothetical protein [Methylomonas lenta]